MPQNQVNFNDIAYGMNFAGGSTNFYGMGAGPMAYSGKGSAGLNPTGYQYAQMMATNNMHADIRARLSVYDRRPDAFARFAGSIYGGRDGANTFSSALGRMPMLQGLASMAINSLSSMTGMGHAFGGAPSDFGGGVLSMLHQNRQLNFSYMDSPAQAKMAADMSRQLYSGFFNSAGFSNAASRGFSGKELNQMVELGVSSGGIKGISFEKSGSGYKLSQSSIKNMQTFVEDSAEMFRELTDVFDSRDFAELATIAEKLTGQSLRVKGSSKKMAQALKEFGSTAKTLGYDQQEYLAMLENSVQTGVSVGGSEQYMRSQTINANRTMLGYDAGNALANRLGLAPSKLDRQGALNAHMLNAAAMDVDNAMLDMNARMYKLQQKLSPEEMSTFMKSMEGMTAVEQQRQIRLKADASGIREYALGFAKDAGHYKGSGIRDLYQNEDVKKFIEANEGETIRSRTMGNVEANLRANGTKNSLALTKHFYALTDKLGWTGAKAMLSGDEKNIAAVEEEFIQRKINAGGKRVDAQNAFNDLRSSTQGIDSTTRKAILSSVTEAESVMPNLAVAFGSGMNTDLAAATDRRAKMFGGVDMALPKKAGGIGNVIRGFLEGDQKYVGKRDAMSLARVVEGEGRSTIDSQYLFKAEALGRDYDENAVTKEFQNALYKHIKELKDTNQFGNDHIFSQIGSAKDIKGKTTLEEIAKAMSTKSLNAQGFVTGLDDDGIRHVATKSAFVTSMMQLQNEGAARNPFLIWKGKYYKDRTAGLLDESNTTMVDETRMSNEFTPNGFGGFNVGPTKEIPVKVKKYLVGDQLNKRMMDAKLSISEQLAVANILNTDGLKTKINSAGSPEELDKILDAAMQDKANDTGDPLSNAKIQQFLKSMILENMAINSKDPKAIADRLLGGDAKELFSITDNPVYADAYKENLTNLLDAMAKSGNNLGYSDEDAKKIKEQIAKFEELRQAKMKTPSDILTELIGMLSTLIDGNKLRVAITG